MVASADMTNIAFIGTGAMGAPMATRLLAAGYHLTVYTRTQERADELIQKGAVWAASTAAAVADADVVITMLAFPEEVEDVYLGTGGIVDNAKSRAYLIDMTTSSPVLAQELDAIAAVNDLHMLDAPVIGGDIAAAEGTLTIVVGGEKDDLAHVRPVLDCMGSRIIFCGESGKGQYMRLCHQVALAGSLIGAAESLALAQLAGLDRELALSILQEGESSSHALYALAPDMIKHNYTSGFFIKHFLKDLGIALMAADEMDLTLPGLETAYQIYDLLSVVGAENMNIAALSLIYEDEGTCATYGLDWSRADDARFYPDDDYDDVFDDDSCDDNCHDCSHLHGHARRLPKRHRSGFEDGGPILGSFFSQN